MVKIELKTLKNMSINSIDRSTIKSIDSIDIDTSLPVEERYKKLLQQTGNPYFFRYDDIVVKVEFSDAELSLQEVLTDTLIRKKNR